MKDTKKTCESAIYLYSMFILKLYDYSFYRHL